ncbi:MAG TPA: thiamine phosphate synthase [Planctomycetota bacterium]|nr:thiamine phosphate synthase [Planctomycetota bacterium]
MNPRFILPRLLAITDAERLGRERVVSQLRGAWEGGLRWALVREPHSDIDSVRALFLALRELDLEGLELSISIRPGDGGRRRLREIVPLGARGVHIGAAPPDAVEEARRERGSALWIGYSAHTKEDVEIAFRAGADYVTFAPVFPPLSKDIGREAAGVEALRDACGAASGPVLALGGITTPRSRLARDAGAYGVAVIGTILDAADPAAATRALLRELE